MAKVRFVKDTEAKINDAPVTDGTIYVSSDTGKMFVDNTDERDQIGIGYTLSKSGSTITLTGEDGSVSTVTDANTTYGDATTSASGLMSASDKTKLNNLDSTISAAIGEEASARQKQDQLLEQAIDDKLGADDIIAGSNVQVNHDDASGHITISATDTKYTAGAGLTLSGTEFGIADGGIIGKYLDDNCVMERNIVVGSVTSDKIPALAITTPKLADNAVTAIKMANNAVATRSIQNGAVTADKLAEGVIPEIPEVTLASLGVTATAQELNYTDGVTSNIQTQLNGKAAVSHTHDDRYYTESETNNLLAAKANTSHTHSAANITSGTLALDRIPTITDAKIQGMSASKLTGTIPQANLPSYVDDVLEYNGKSNFPDTGESGKIYVDTSTNKTYRWSGSGYTEISASLALGTTSSTAFRGDYGNTAYQHATAKGSAFASGLYKITTNAQGHVTAATAVTKSDITALGIPAQDTNTTYGVASSSANGLMSAADKAKLDGIASGANKTTVDSALSATSTNPVQNKVIKAAIDGKAASSHTHAATQITGLTASRALVSDASGHPAVSSVTSTELGYLDGVTSNIQTQLNGKAAASHNHSAANITSGTLAIARGGTGATTAAAARTALGITPANIGAAASSHTHSYLPLSGGTLTGAVTHSAKNNRYSCSGGSWINGKTATNVPIVFPTASETDGSRYDPYMWGQNTDGDVWNFGGGASNQVGFFGFNKGRTENSTDWSVYMDITTGKLTATAGFAGALSGNATTATTLQTARTINGTSFNGGKNITTANWGTARTLTIGSTGKSVNGSGNVSWSLSEIGAAAANHTHSYLPLSGGTLTGTLKARAITPSADSTYDIGTSSVRYRNVYADTFTGSLSGNATTASRLATARTISLSGAVSGSASFNGSGNITINTTMPSTGVGTVAVSSSQPTNSNVVLWVKP